MTTLRTELKSKLGISLQMYRADRPDEWAMDDFTRLAEKMQARIEELEDAMCKIRSLAEDGDGDHQAAPSCCADIVNIAYDV